MEKNKKKNVYTSESILGKLFRAIDLEKEIK